MPEIGSSGRYGTAWPPNDAKSSQYYISSMLAVQQPPASCSRTTYNLQHEARKAKRLHLLHICAAKLGMHKRKLQRPGTP